MEIQADPTTLRNYINQYTGNTRFTRLLAIAEKQAYIRLDAIKLCLELAKAEKKLK